MALKRGNEIVVKERVDTKELRMYPKVNNPIKVVLAGINDYVEVPSHSDFNARILPQSCLSIVDQECPYCEAHKKGKNEMKPFSGYMFAFYNVDEGKVMFWRATSAQAKKMIKQIKDFAEDIEYGTMFLFERTGKGKDTAYMLTPVAERKLSKSDEAVIAKVKEITVEDSLFEAVCEPVSLNFAKELVYNAYKIGEKPIKNEDKEGAIESDDVAEDLDSDGLPF